MSRIEYNPSLNDKVNGQLGDLDVAIQIPLSSIKELIVPPAPEAPYKVFTALVSQTGGDDPSIQTGGSLQMGRTYRIESNDGDYTNVGAPNNDEYTYFIATSSEAPTTWGSLGLSFNTGAPTVTVLENTIGNIWFQYVGAGSYTMHSDNLFTVYKTFIQNIVLNSAPDFLIFNSSSNIIELYTNAGDGGLNNIPIEIRVYN